MGRRLRLAWMARWSHSWWPRRNSSWSYGRGRWPHRNPRWRWRRRPRGNSQWWRWWSRGSPQWRSRRRWSRWRWSRWRWSWRRWEKTLTSNANPRSSGHDSGGRLNWRPSSFWRYCTPQTFHPEFAPAPAIGQLLAQSGHAHRVRECRYSGVKQTLRLHQGAKYSPPSSAAPLGESRSATSLAFAPGSARRCRARTAGYWPRSPAPAPRLRAPQPRISRAPAR
jgi:hypothetical protein